MSSDERNVNIGVSNNTGCETGCGNAFKYTFMLNGRQHNLCRECYFAFLQREKMIAYDETEEIVIDLNDS